MIAYPWYLLALGIIVLIVGLLMAQVWTPRQSELREIDSDMRDDEIVENLNSRNPISIPGIVIFVGMMCIFASIVWRVGRRFF